MSRSLFKVEIERQGHGYVNRMSIIWHFQLGIAMPGQTISNLKIVNCAELAAMNCEGNKTYEGNYRYEYDN